MPFPGTPFKRSEAGEIDSETQQAILRLESAGKRQRQMAAARVLVELRDNE